MAEDREYELKFALKHGAQENLLAHRLLRHAAAKRETHQLVSTYFDTPDGLLRRKRLSLRMRRSGDRLIQTLKGPGRSMVDRDEWESEATGPTPDVDWLRATPHAAVFDDDVVAALGPRFTVDVSRTVLPIVHDGAEIEGALDEGTIRAQNLSLKLREFELELKAGPSAAVPHLAHRLVRDVPLTLCLPTKAERGYSALDGSWNEPTKTIPLDLSGLRKLNDVFGAVVQACLHTIYRNTTMIGGTRTDEEAIHTTRIAVRHLRAALALFRPALRRKRLDRIDRDLKWLCDKLGAARDADVFQHGVDAVAARGQMPDAPLVAERMRIAREDAHRRLREALASRRARLLLLDLLMVSIDGMRRRMRGRRAAPFLRRRLHKHHAALSEATRGWAHLSEAAIHDIRKSAKTLRYGLDLLDTLPKIAREHGRLGDLSDDLQTMQKTLGDHHDGVALRDRLGEQFLRRPAPHGVPSRQWRHVQGVAGRIAGSTPQHNKLLGKAHQAAKRIRRNAAF